MALIPCAVVSASYILLTMFLAEVGRKVTEAVLAKGLVRTAALELIAAAEMCGSCFELIIIADNYGVTAYAVCLFLLTIWWAQQWGEATACPYIQMEDLLQGSINLVEAAVRIGAQVVGGLLVFRYVIANFGVCKRPHFILISQFADTCKFYGASNSPRLTWGVHIRPLTTNVLRICRRVHPRKDHA